MEHLPTFSDQLDVDYISHHGIKGMHWGVRRYQNPDGSYTSAGKARYNTNKSNSKRSFSKSKAAKIAAGVAITAAGATALAYANNKINERNVNAYCEKTRKSATDFVSEVDATYHACAQAVSSNWASVDAAMCRTNARNTRQQANDMFDAYLKRRADFADHPAIKETDRVMSTARDSLLQYASDFDKLAKKLTKRQNTTQQYENRAAEFRARQGQKWAEDRAARKAQEAREYAARLQRAEEAAKERAKQERLRKEREEWDRVYNR